VSASAGTSPANDGDAAPLPEPEVPAVEQLVLAGAFPPVERVQWQRLVLGVLRKSGRLDGDATPAQAELALASVLPDGFAVQGLYTAEGALPPVGVPGLAPFTRGGTAAGATGGGWDVRQRHDDPDPATTHRAALDDLEGGGSSVWLTLGGGGLPVAALGEVLDGVYVDLAPVVLDAGGETADAAAAYLSLAAERGVADDDLLGVLGADPLGLAARTGTVPDLGVATSLARRCADRHPGVRAVVVDGLPYADAGATDGQELGLALATAVAYLRALTEAGLDAAQACGQLEFRSSASADQFVTIAKLRAARRLWARVTEVAGLAPAGRAQRQHAVTSWAMTATADPYTNLLRSTIACFAAGVGGADAVTVLPFDAALGLPDAVSRRLARNTSALLLEESHVAATVDPAGGSWAVEALTDELARAGWAVFREVERAGGMAAALASGLVADRLAASAAARTERLSTGVDGIIGVTEFPDLAASPLVRRAAPPGPTGGLPRVRAAEPFEQLRGRSAAAAAARPQRVVLVTVGAGKAAAAAATGIGKRLAAGGVTAAPATPADLPDLAGGVAVLCAAPEGDVGELAGARAAAETGGAVLVLDGAQAVRGGTLALLEQVLAVLAPEPEPETAQQETAQPETEEQP